MKSYLYFFQLLLLISIVSCKQSSDHQTKTKDVSHQVIDWTLLSKISFENKMVDSLQQTIPFPIFNDSLKMMNAKSVTLSGFIIPIEEIGEADLLVLSANPYASCFFCGKAGVESVVEIHLKNQNNKAYQTDKRMTFKGILRLNNTDPNYLPYIMEAAGEVE